MSEELLQQECFIWHSNNYPDKRGLLYHNYNNPRNEIQGAKLKSLGLVSGVADLTLLHNKKTFFFELKTAEGKQSKRQKEWERQVTANEFYYKIIRSLADFQKEIHYIYNTF